MSQYIEFESAFSPRKQRLLKLLLDNRRNRADQTGPISASAERNHFPVSFAQRRFWFLNRLMRGEGYTINRAVRLKGPLNIPAVERAITEIHRRHEILRTTIGLVEDNLQQVVHPPQAFHIPVEDLREVSPPDRDRTIENLTEIETVLPFDLAKGPFLRIRILQFEDDDHVMLLSIHHIVCDGWSIAVLLTELATIYKAFLHGLTSPLPELGIQYGDFALWQRAQMEGAIGISQRAYWRRKLHGMPPSLKLPTDRARPALRQMRGAMQSITVPKQLREKVYALGRKHDATLFMVLLTAFVIVLFRYTNQDDFAIGSPIANRRRRETELLIGAFINTLIFRVMPRRSLSVSDLLEQVRRTALEAYDNQDLPFEEIVNELRPNRDLNEQPLFQVLLVLRNEPIEKLELPDVNVNFLPSTRFSAPFDLNLSIHELGDELSCWMLYDADLFDGSTIQRLMGCFRNVLEAMSHDPTQSIGTLELSGLEERQQLLAGWNPTSIPRAEKCIHEMFRDQVDEAPDALAVVFGEASLTYEELHLRSNQLANWLRSQGVKPEVLVGVCMERSLELVIALLGVLKAGGAYVPLDPSYPEQRLKFMTEDAQVPVILTQHPLMDSLPSYGARVLCLDSEWEIITRESDAEPRVELSGNNLAYMIYTSGSTGTPKGAMNTHRGIHNRLVWMQEAYGLQRAERVLQKTPFSFDVSVWEFFWPLMVGATLVMARADGHRDVAYLVHLIQNKAITTVHFVPSLLQAFLAHDGVRHCTSLKRVICSGEALSAELKEQFFSHLKCELHNLYGPSEAAVDVTFWACRSDDHLPIVPIGKPISNTQVYVLDPWMKVTPIGVPGELYLGGDGLARGYWGRPDLTAAKFVPNPFGQSPGERIYKTGDLARWREDGYLEYLGRTDHQVKLRGYRIELGEIETALLHHSQVREAVVLAREDHPSDKRLVGYVVKKENGDDLNGTTLTQYLQQTLPVYMVPSAFVMLEALPLGPNGKIDRSGLPAPMSDRLIPGVRNAMPEGHVEREIVGAWRDVLHLDSIGIDENLFDLGANSLDTVRIQNALKRRLHHEFELIELFRFPTVRSLATHLDSPADLRSATSKTLQAQALEVGKKRLRRQRSRLNAARPT